MFVNNRADKQQKHPSLATCLDIKKSWFVSHPEGIGICCEMAIKPRVDTDDIEIRRFIARVNEMLICDDLMSDGVDGVSPTLPSRVLTGLSEITPSPSRAHFLMVWSFPHWTQRTVTLVYHYYMDCHGATALVDLHQPKNGSSKKLMLNYKEVI